VCPSALLKSAQFIHLLQAYILYLKKQPQNSSTVSPCNTTSFRFDRYKFVNNKASFRISSLNLNMERWPMAKESSELYGLFENGMHTGERSRPVQDKNRRVLFIASSINQWGRERGKSWSFYTYQTKFQVEAYNIHISLPLHLARHPKFPDPVNYPALSHCAQSKSSIQW
jgi:hypothetical protein